MAWKSTDGTTHAGVVTFHRLDDAQTRVSVQLDGEPEGMIEKACAAIGADDRQVAADLKRFKEFVEQRGKVEGGWRGGRRPQLSRRHRGRRAGVIARGGARGCPKPT